jgi:hypothetical protein
MLVPINATIVVALRAVLEDSWPTGRARPITAIVAALPVVYNTAHDAGARKAIVADGDDFPHLITSTR